MLYESDGVAGRVKLREAVNVLVADFDRDFKFVLVSDLVGVKVPDSVRDWFELTVLLWVALWTLLRVLDAVNELLRDAVGETANDLVAERCADGLLDSLPERLIVGAPLADVDRDSSGVSVMLLVKDCV